MDNSWKRTNDQSDDAMSSTQQPKRPRISVPHRFHSAGNDVLDVVDIDASDNCDSDEEDSQQLEQRRKLNSALKNKNYAVVLSLLERDVPFPKNFCKVKIDRKVKGAEPLLDFIVKRCSLHHFIKLDEVRCEELNNNSKLHLNIKNESALYVAATRKQFKAYSVLLGSGAAFKSDNERAKALKALNAEERRRVENMNSVNFQQVEKGYLTNLVLKSKSSGFKNDDKCNSFVEKVREYYEKMDQIPELSSILKVLDLLDNLNIMFDFERRTTCGICLTSKSNTEVGVTKYVEGKVYIGAKRDEKEVLGTIAHELTHLAMEIIYENHCLPYEASDEENERNYTTILGYVNRKLDHDAPNGIAEGILSDGFAYSTEDDICCEAIVRVSQILIEVEGGRDWLKTNCKGLYEYYKKVISDCNSFVEDGSVTRVRRKVKNLNEIVGELSKIKELNVVSFKNEDKTFSQFINCEDNFIFLVKTKNPTLTLLKTLHVFYGNKYIKYRYEYLVVKGQKFLNNTHLQLITSLLKTSVVKYVIIELDLDDDRRHPNPSASNISSSDDEMFNLVKCISAIRQQIRPTLKFVLLAKENEHHAQNNLGNMKENYLDYDDHGFKLNDLSNDSIDKIMDKSLVFQGRPMKLKDIITKNKDWFNFVELDTIEKFLEKNVLFVGGDVLNSASLDGAYIDEMDQKINLQNFNYHLNTKTDELFIVSNLRGEDKKNELRDIIKNNESSVNISAAIEKESGEFKSECKTPTNKKILFVNYQLSVKDFKLFCKVNANKKIFYLKREEASLFLKIYYNPFFYVNRKFTMTQKVIDETALKELIKSDEHKSDLFIISGLERDKNGLQFEKPPPNLEFLDEGTAFEKFREYTELKKTAHLIDCKSGLFFLIDSNGSIKNLRAHFTKTIARKIYDEDGLIEQMKFKKIVILCDEPGMGKSTTLTKLYEKLSVDNWFIKINLKDCVRNLRMVDEKNFIETLVQFLAESEETGALNTNLNKNFLNLALRSGDFLKPLLIAVDGFDEVGNDIDRRKILYILKRLTNNYNVKIWIASRSNFKTMLEDELSTFAVEFKQFSQDLKRKFMIDYYENRFCLAFNTNQLYPSFFPQGKKKALVSGHMIGTYVENLLMKLNEIFKNAKKAEKLMETPLQINLILQESIDSFNKYIVNRDFIPDFEFLGKNLLQIYKNFVGMKYDSYFKKTRKTDKAERGVFIKYFEDFNKNLAESLTLNLDLPNHILKEEIGPEYKILMQSTGILSQTENFEFIHFTFRDYFSAIVFVQYIKEERVRVLDFNLIEILLKNIFLKPEFQLTRTFINLHFEDLQFGKLRKELLRKLGEGIDLIWGRSPSLIFKKGTPLYVAKIENNKFIFDFLLYCCNQVFQIDDVVEDDS